MVLVVFPSTRRAFIVEYFFSLCGVVVGVVVYVVALFLAAAQKLDKGGGGGVHLDSHQFSVVIYYYTCGFITRPTKKKRKEAGKRRINE